MKYCEYLRDKIFIYTDLRYSNIPLWCEMLNEGKFFGGGVGGLEGWTLERLEDKTVSGLNVWRPASWIVGWLKGWRFLGWNFSWLKV